MDELILYDFKRTLIRYITINNYSVAHARAILNGKHYKYGA